MDIRSIGLRRWCINITITILGIIHRPVLFKARRFGYGLRIREEATKMVSIDRATLCLRSGADTD
jgi:hypothetical protein